MELQHLMHTRKRLAVRLGVTGVLAIGGSVAGAWATMTASLPARPDLPPPGLLALDDPSGAEACSVHSNDGQGGTPGTQPQVCQGSGLSFIGPTVVMTTQIGPTTIGPALVNSVEAGGNVAGV
jgi:hypothetical protein